MNSCRGRLILWLFDVMSHQHKYIQNSKQNTVVTFLRGHPSYVATFLLQQIMVSYCNIFHAIQYNILLWWILLDTESVFCMLPVLVRYVLYVWYVCHFRGHTPEWYNKVYGQLCVNYVQRIKDSFCQKADGPETNVWWLDSLDNASLWFAQFGWCPLPDWTVWKFVVLDWLVHHWLVAVTGTAEDYCDTYICLYSALIWKWKNKISTNIIRKLDI
jgi:hypothetical protein